MERRRHRVDLRNFLEREVPVSRLSPDLRQRVRHVLAGHGDLLTTTAEVVRELLDAGILRRAGVVLDGVHRVAVYGLPGSGRVYDLRALLERIDSAPVPRVPPADPVPPMVPAASTPPQLEPGATEAHVAPAPSPEDPSCTAELTLRSVRQAFERDWVSFGIESALDSLLAQIQSILGDIELEMILWSEDAGPGANSGRHWRRVDEADQDVRPIAVRLREQPVLAGDGPDGRCWYRIHVLTEIVGAIGLPAAIPRGVGEEAAQAVGGLLMAALRSAKRVYQDSLTGLHNRAFFDSQLSVELERAVRLGQPLALLFVDIDHFKRVNDEYGHDVGDLLLEHVSRTIAGHLRRIDQVFRWGGEEFVVLLPGTGPEEGYLAAERLRSVVETSPLTLANGTVLATTVSVGVALAPEHALGGDRAFLRHADQALYAAKESGRNRTVVYGG